MLSHHYLHSTMVLFKSSNSASPVVEPSFTFHYGSIQIDKEIHSSKGAERFTFHYGSIQIIMFLLNIIPNWIYIPLWFYSNSKIKTIYKIIQIYLHSTMVLFKWYHKRLLQSISRFTFHYGSIQIVNQEYM